MSTNLSKNPDKRRYNNENVFWSELVAIYKVNMKKCICLKTRAPVNNYVTGADKYELSLQTLALNVVSATCTRQFRADMNALSRVGLITFLTER